MSRTEIAALRPIAEVARDLDIPAEMLEPYGGRKGGATGGGASKLEPSNTINLQFTGDFHAITAAHNLLAAAIDNLIHFRKFHLDPTKVLWKRVMDMNDRALRHIVIGLGGRPQ